MSLESEYIYQDCKICVSSEYPNLNEVHFSINRISSSERSELKLIALWIPPLDKNSNNVYSKFKAGDYFQQTFISEPPRKGLGTSLHDFCILNRYKLGFVIENIYSTNPNEDAYEFSDDARKFWDNRVRHNKATFDVGLNRYRIIWQDPISNIH